MMITRENVFDYVTKTVDELTGRETFTSTDGKLKIVATKRESDRLPRGIMKLWKKTGLIKKELDTYVCIDTYYYEDEHNCTSKYNATVKRDIAHDRGVINFDYLMEWTEENIIDIVIACLNMRAKGIEEYTR